MNLNVLLEPEIDLPRLCKVLDELGHIGRLDTIRGWTKKTQARLFEAVQGHKPLSLDDFVPPGTEPLREVIHHGKNTLPSFTHFQKRFCKSKDPEKKDLLGYNQQAFIGITGPGYFVVHPGRTEGEVDIDYLHVPSEKPDTWPPISDNDHGFGKLVYGGMVDVMRGISSHVTIGRAMKGGKWMDAWFVLCREDPHEG